MQDRRSTIGLGDVAIVKPNGWVDHLEGIKKEDINSLERDVTLIQFLRENKYRHFLTACGQVLNERVKEQLTKINTLFPRFRQHIQPLTDSQLKSLIEQIPNDQPNEPGTNVYTLSLSS